MNIKDSNLHLKRKLILNSVEFQLTEFKLKKPPIANATNGFS